MSSPAAPDDPTATYPVDVRVEPVLENRDRLTTGFRLILALPHLILVGGPLAAVFSWTGASEDGFGSASGGGGVLGAVAFVCAVIAWIAIVFTGRHPVGLWKLAAFYLRWRVKAVAYTALLRDEYPPFGDGPYPAAMELTPPEVPRDRVSVGFRIFLAIPHIIIVWVLGVGWGFTTIIAWFVILFTGAYPIRLYEFGVGVLRWNTRVEAYLLLLRDEYPPFSFE